MRAAGEREKIFYLSGLPINYPEKNDLISYLARRHDVRWIDYLPRYRAPAKVALDLRTGTEAAAAEIMRQADGRPVRLLGYSNGGYAAVHVARRLRAQDVEVAALVMVDSSCYYPPKRETRFADRLGAFGIPGLPNACLLWALEVLIKRRAFETARRLFLASTIIHAGRPSRAAITRLLVAFWQEAVKRFPPQPYDGRTSLLTAEKPRPRIDDAMLGWGPYLSEIEKVILPGNHWTMVSEPLASINAAVVEDRLGLSGIGISEDEPYWRATEVS